MGGPVRFVHSADWQLGMTRAFLAAGSGEAQSRFAAARLDAVRALGAVARDEGAAFVVVCGDVFESNLVGPDVVGRACEALRAIDVPVLLLPGNHDPADAACVLRRADLARRCPEHVVVLDRPGTYEVAPGIEVVAAPWASKRPLTDLVADALRDLSPAPAGPVRVLAAHGALETLSPDPSDPARIALDPVRAALADGRVHYVALGDRHSTWQLPGDPRVAYSGAPEVTAFDEVDPGNVLVVDLSTDLSTDDAGTGACEARRVPVGRWRFVRLAASVDTAADVADLDARLTALPDKERTAVRLGLVGTLTLRDRAALDDVLAAHGPVFADLELRASRSDLAVRPDDADLADLSALGLGGFARTAADELHRTAAEQDGDGAGAALDALGLLHRLAGGVR